MRKLATIQKITSLTPIENADNLELARVLGWNVVVSKGEFNVGDLVVYFEIDSFLPIKPEFEFLRSRCYKKMADGTEGFRLRTISLRKQVSQGLIAPLNVLEGHIETDITSDIYQSINDNWIGRDVSSVLNVIKYEPPIPAELQGVAKGQFPSFLQKTDEDRIQIREDILENYGDCKFDVAEKIDGSSSTFYYNNGEFGVCSRNLELERSETNSMWKFATESGLEKVMRQYGKNIALQGEIIGEGIQGNKYKLKGQTVYFFTAFDINNHKRIHLGALLIDLNLLAELNKVQKLKRVPYLDTINLSDHDVDSLVEFSKGKSALNPSTEREGIVLRKVDDQHISFKVINPKFLLKFEE